MRAAYDDRMTKQRLTVSLDPHLVDAAHQAVASGAAESVSSWVGKALEDLVRREQRLALLAGAIGDYEAEHGVITPEEIERQRRTDRSSARVVRGQR